jgi:hypothetical protein
MPGNISCLKPAAQSTSTDAALGARAMQLASRCTRQTLTSTHELSDYLADISGKPGPVIPRTHRLEHLNRKFFQFLMVLLLARRPVARITLARQPAGRSRHGISIWTIPMTRHGRSTRLSTLR